MDRNIEQTIAICEIAKLIKKLKTSEEVMAFLNEVLTESEIDTLSKRWRILKMLRGGSTQRDVSSKMGVSLCKVTRGAKLLKNENSLTSKYLLKEKFNG